MLLWALIAILCHLQGAATTSVSAKNEFVSWQQEPNGRGTWAILSSCIITLVLCVYTAVHMNVPNASASSSERRLRLLQWVAAGVFAPETVVLSAWSQWETARTLSKELQSLRQVSDENDQSAPLRTSFGAKYQSQEDLLASWTIQHSFLVVMGGYQFHPTVVEQTGSVPRTVLTPESFLALLKAGHADKFPLLSAKDIADRSKADNVAKTLSCIQGLWLVFQLLGRTLTHLTITELEVNTLAHVICAVAMYAFWMFKPLNIQQPVFVDPTGLESWLVLYSGNRYFDNLLSDGKVCRRNAVPGQTRTVHEHDDYMVDGGCFLCRSNLCPRKPLICLVLRHNTAMTPAEVVSKLQQSNSSFFGIDYVMRSNPECELHSNGVEKQCEDGLSRIAIFVDKSQLDALLRIWNLPDRDELLSSFDKDDRLKPKALSVRETSSPWAMVAMTVCSSLYGGLHATLWNHYFPTRVELWMWRVASIIVASQGALMFGWLMLETIMWYATPAIVLRLCGGHDILDLIRVPIEKFTKRDRSQELPISGYLREEHEEVTDFSIIGLGALVFVCRAYLFIEAFVSLRSQPPTAYLTPSWSRWIPHL